MGGDKDPCCPQEHVPAHAQVLDPAQMHSAMQQAMMVQQWQQHLQQCAAQAQFSPACPPGQPGQQLGLPGAPCYDHPPPQPTPDAGGSSCSLGSCATRGIPLVEHQ